MLPQRNGCVVGSTPVLSGSPEAVASRVDRAVFGLVLLVGTGPLRRARIAVVRYLGVGVPLAGFYFLYLSADEITRPRLGRRGTMRRNLRAGDERRAGRERRRLPPGCPCSSLRTDSRAVGAVTTSGHSLPAG